MLRRWPHAMTLFILGFIAGFAAATVMVLW
jgi:hypothetical protein